MYSEDVKRKWGTETLTERCHFFPPEDTSVSSRVCQGLVWVSYKVGSLVAEMLRLSPEIHWLHDDAVLFKSKRGMVKRSEYLVRMRAAKVVGYVLLPGVVVFGASALGLLPPLK